MSEKSPLLAAMTEEELDARHAEKMRKKKAARYKILATKTEVKGLVIVHTGKGKGKSTAAFGLVFRALGNGMKVGIVQFVKGKWETGERRALDRFPGEVTITAMGDGFTWETQDRRRDIEAARAAWERAKALILDEEHGMVILDELNIVLRDDTLPIAEIVAFLKDRPLTKHICITGRNAKEELLTLADLVTEFGEVKHPYHAGFKAQKGVEY